jgi:hypothetical protein
MDEIPNIAKLARSKYTVPFAEKWNVPGVEKVTLDPSNAAVTNLLPKSGTPK